MALLGDYRLTDRYLKDQGTSFLTGIQALARVPIQQLRVDRLAGLNTAAFVSGRDSRRRRIDSPPNSTRESVRQSCSNPLLFVFEDQRGPVANHAFDTGDAIQHQVTQAVGIGDAHVDD